MGTWTYYHGKYRPLKNAEIKKELIDREFASCTVHAISIPKWGEAYVAYSNPLYVKDPSRVFCAVVKIACNNSSEIGFKVMGEECGPCYYNCPKKILKMLSPLPTDENDPKYYEWALNWREECWKNFKKKA